LVTKRGPKSRFSPADLTQFAKWKAEGRTNAEIATMARSSPATISRVMRERKAPGAAGVVADHSSPAAFVESHAGSGSLGCLQACQREYMRRLAADGDDAAAGWRDAALDAFRARFRPDAPPVEDDDQAEDEILRASADSGDGDDWSS